METIIALFIPYLLILAIAAVLISSEHFKYRRQHEMQVTLRSALEKGQELPVEALDAIGRPKPSPNRDLRRGVMLIALAVGLAPISFAFGEGQSDGVLFFLSVACVLFAIGVGLVVLWFVRKRIE